MRMTDAPCRIAADAVGWGMPVDPFDIEELQCPASPA
jgi:hypothetical protein